MPKVYASQATRHDIAQAEMYGEIVVLCFGDIMPGHNEDDTTGMMNRAASILHESYDPEQDHILLTGNPVLVGWALHIAFEVAEQKNAKTISWLYWNRREEFYAPCRIPVPAFASREKEHDHSDQLAV